MAGSERLRETLENWEDPDYAATHVVPWVFAGVGVFNVPPVTLASIEYAPQQWTYDLEFVVSARDVDAEAYTTTLTFEVTDTPEEFLVRTNWTPLRKAVVDRAASQESRTRESGV